VIAILFSLLESFDKVYAEIVSHFLLKNMTSEGDRPSIDASILARIGVNSKEINLFK